MTEPISEHDTDADGVEDQQDAHVATNGAETTVAQATGETDTAVAETGSTGSKSAGKEAARYRSRLRATEAERDELAATLTASRRALAEHHAAAAGIRPAALWAAGTELEDLLDAEGEVSGDLVTAAATAASEKLGLARVPRPDHSQGAHGEPAHRDNWQAAFLP
jgi:hypothetical protein